MIAPPVLLGSYDSPLLRKGARVRCLYRLALCKVTAGRFASLLSRARWRAARDQFTGNTGW